MTDYHAQCEGLLREVAHLFLPSHPLHVQVVVKQRLCCWLCVLGHIYQAQAANPDSSAGFVAPEKMFQGESFLGSGMHYLAW